MRSGLIVHKKAGKDIGVEYANAMLKTHSMAMGVAVVMDGIVENDTYMSDEIVLADQLKEIQDTYKANDVFFYFQHIEDLEKEFDFDSVQPFNVLVRSGQGKEDDVSLLSVIMDVDDTTFAKDKEGPVWPEYHLLNEYLAEKIKACYKRHNGDMKATCEELSTELVKKEILASTINRADILVIPSVGPPFAYNNNNLGRHYSWGYGSKHLNVETDIKEGEEPKPIVDLAVKPKSLRDRKMTLPTPDKKVEAMPPGPTNNPPKEEEPKEKTDIAGSAGCPFKIETVNDVEWVSFSGNNFTNAKTAWNRNTTLTRPGEEKKVFAGFPVTALKVGSPIYGYLLDLAKADGTHESAFKSAFAAAQKKEEAKAKALVDNPQVIPLEDKKKALELIKDKGLFGYSAEQLMDEVKAVDPFSKQLGQTDMAPWFSISERGMYKLPKSALIRLFSEYRLEQLTTKPAVVTEEVKAPIEEKKPSLRDRRKVG